MQFSVIKTAFLNKNIVYLKQFLQEKHIVCYLILLHWSQKIIKKAMYCELPIGCTNYSFDFLLYDTNFASEKFL